MLVLLLRQGSQDELASSLLFNERTFYTQFKQDLERARKEIVIESPFMTNRRVNSLLHSLRKAVQRGVRITVNTREPEEHEGFLRQEAEWAVPALNTADVG